MADKVFDTSDLTVHELRRVFTDLSRGGPEKQLVVTLLSFGYKYGVPLEADLLLDVRFLPNPHFVPDLRPLTGRDRKVQEYVNAAPSTHTFLEKTTGPAPLPHSRVRWRRKELSDDRNRMYRRATPIRDDR